MNSVLLLFIVLLVFFSFIIYLIIKMLDKHKLKKLRRNYNAEENKSKKPEPGAIIQPRREYPRLPTIGSDIRNKAVERTEQEFGKPTAGISGNAEFKGRELFQDESAVSAGENEQAFRKHRRLIGRRRIRRRTEELSEY